MAKDKIGQTWPISSVISALDAKLPAPLDVFQDFPDPLALYSLYCIIAKRRPCNEKPDPNFRPFKAREYSEVYEVVGDYLFWVRTLEEFLGERLVFSNSNHRATLTNFGKQMYLALMEAFLSLYQHNDIFESLKGSWKIKCEKSIFSQFNN